MRFRKFLFEMAQGSQGQGSDVFTEIPPAIWWNYKIDPFSMSDEENFEYIQNNIEKFSNVFKSDKNRVINHYRKGLSDSYIKQYMGSSRGFYKFLKQQDKLKPIKEIKWTGTGKTGKAKKRSRADIIIIYNDNTKLGISLKADKSIPSDERIPNPILNSGVLTFLKKVSKDWKKEKSLIRDDLYSKVFSNIVDKNIFNGPKNKLEPIIKKFKKEDKQKYEYFRKENQQIVKSHIIRVINDPNNLERLKKYIVDDYFGKSAKDVTTMTVFGANNKFFIVWTEEYVNLYINNVNEIKAVSKGNAGDIEVNLISDKIPGKKITLSMNTYEELWKVSALKLYCYDMKIKK